MAKKTARTNPRLDALNEVRRAFCALLNKYEVKAQGAVFTLNADSFKRGACTLYDHGMRRLIFRATTDRDRPTAWEIRFELGDGRHDGVKHVRRPIYLTYATRSPMSLRQKAGRWTPLAGGTWHFNAVKHASADEEALLKAAHKALDALPISQGELDRDQLTQEEPSSPASRIFLCLLEQMVKDLVAG